MIAGFEEAEFARRTETLQTLMAEHRLDALLLTGPADIFYVTGFLTQFWESPARPWFVVLPKTGRPIAVIPTIGVPLMGASWVGEILSWSAPDPVDDGVSLLAETLRAHVPQTGRLGLPMGLETHLRMPLADWSRVQDLIAPRAIVDATPVLHRVREIKSEAEIDRIRHTCAVADAAFAKVPQLVQETPQQDAVARGFQAALLEAGADWVSYLACASGPGGYGDIIAPAQPVPLEKGDVLMLDTGAVRAGYFCDFDRNYAVGPPCSGVATAHGALHGAIDDTLAEIRPGLQACDVHGLLAGGLEQRGARPGAGRMGHGLGLTLTEWPSFTPADQTPLRAGMVLTLEPSAEMEDGRMLVHEENIVLREDGAELLSSRAAPELEVIDL